jgi:competence protein ComEC
LRIAITAFIAGGSLLFFLPEVPHGWFWVCLFSCLLCFALLIFGIKHGQLKNTLIAILFFFMGFAWNANYAETRLANILPEELEGKDFHIEGRVVALPQSSPQSAKFAFEIDCIASRKSECIEQSKRIYLSWQPAWRDGQAIPVVKPGQRWKLLVKLKRPYGTLNPYTFDFERWAFHQDFGASGSVKAGHLLQDKDIGFTEFALRMELARWNLREKIYALLPSNARYAGVIIALVMGDQNAINQDDWQVFNATGIGHLISISGLHVTMLAGFGASIAALCWRRRSLPLLVPVNKAAAAAGFITAFIYAWLAGFQIPAQRTMYMVGVVAYALWVGRTPRTFDIWWWALAFVLLIDPLAPYTPGFWLSFGAVAAILFAMKDSAALLGIPTGKESHLGWMQRALQALREACRVQAVVTIALLPITLYWFYQVSIVSPIANAIAIPVVSYIVTPLSIVGAFLPDFIGRWFLMLAHISMEWLAVMLDWMASWQWSVVWAKQPETWILFVSIVGIIYAIRPGDLRSTWRTRLFTLSPLTLLFYPVMNLSEEQLRAGEFRATVFDIGQGTAVLVETLSKTLLYDTGPIQGKKDDAGQRILMPYLRGRGMSQIDRLVISHSDSDHTGGGASLLKQVQFNAMMGSLPSNNPLLLNIQSRKIPNIPCRYGQHWKWDEVEFFIWHPHEETVFQNQYSQKPNEMSCVLEIRNRTSSLWLTGDVEKQGESEMSNRLTRQALEKIGNRQLVFMAPHHGSKTSSSEELLDKLSPNLAFAQNGYKNRYGHPHSIVESRYTDRAIPFLLTPNTGAQIWHFFASKSVTTHFLRRENKRLWHRKGEDKVGRLGAQARTAK